ncbi:twin-arginine translocase subunit TatC [Mangrovibacillus cuniculi]|uniref:Sec-independent protein translocase protein TatC n=1 Tax=Mangrovibacillus cuniculi TaxID=2593652 RepID=A0A7S8C920_9BACI|nr:twin-arginine translocase subunit TatC [Mangrovibacillus cuniculi]QPC45646.1 twin-arginine translocase subunit TatC [Mangrovibacillus cuniculi]
MVKGNEMLFTHMQELRQRMIYVLIVYVVFLVAGFVFVKKLYHWLLQNAEVSLTVLGPSEILWIYFMLASLCSISLTIPFIAYQVWAFIRPALKQEERKATLVFIPLLFILFIGGIAFGYFVVFPSVYAFIVSLSSGMFDTTFTVEKYFRFLLQITLPLGLLFEMPAVVLFLTKLRLLTPTVMMKYRKYVLFALVIISAVVTPPDFISQLFVLIPMILLYEASIIICKIVYNRQKERDLVFSSS